MLPYQPYSRGLYEPLSASEYAKLEGLDENDVLEAIQSHGLGGVYSLGWYLEAPPYSEERFSRLRAESKLEPRLLNWLQRRADLHDNPQYKSEVERLRVHFIKSDPRFDELPTADQSALINTREYAQLPEPVDYEEELHVWPWRRRRPNPEYLRYLEALQLHKLYQRAAQAAAREAEQAFLRKKRSYWEFLDGYAFERATAEVLQLHQFNPRVTPGSADGGIDIEVTRNGLKGVVQCKAHVACIGPHIVRDLFGVMHHSRADFGIIVSRGGFTKGAIEFARDKPIFLIGTSDLIAMHEGRDVLAGEFKLTT